MRKVFYGHHFTIIILNLQSAANVENCAFIPQLEKSESHPIKARKFESHI